MKFTVNWLKKYIDFDLSNNELADKLTMLGLEVDAVDQLFHNLDNVKVAKIIEVKRHPNADKLVLCDVDTGEEIKRVVCGAPNAKAGMMTAIALPGAVLPNDFTVKKAKIRGEASEGMLCSEKDLGISDDHHGIMDLTLPCEPGQTIAFALDLTDTLIEVDLTPNRPDCTSVIGVAREVAGVVNGKKVMPSQAGLPQLDGNSSFEVEVSAPDACPRYAARLLKNIKIGPSPWWLKRILLAVGLRPINNVVDITNFVMLELGQPLHAFDYKHISGGKIIVRKANQGEKTTTLDGAEHQLDKDMLLICDAENPVAIAGVMGGKNSEVSDDTTDVLLESAYFNPLSVRRTSRVLKLSTDSSYRFERGIDPNGTINALDRAAQLMIDLAGGELVGTGIDHNSGIKEPEPIKLRVSKTNELLGIDLTLKEVADYLNGIEISTVQLDEDTLQVIAPSFRVDLEREVDLVEEVARLKGFNNIPTTLPTVPMSFSEQESSRTLRQQLVSILVSQGLNETVNYSFTAERHFDELQLPEDDQLRKSVRILNPLTDDQGIMRTMLLPGLLVNVKHNLNRQNNDVALFEIGKIFLPVDGNEQPNEEMRLMAVFSGRRTPGSSVYHYGEDTVDLLDVKGVAESIFKELRLAIDVVSGEDASNYLEPDNFVNITNNNKKLGSIGKINKSVLKKFGIKQEVFILDINLEQVADHKPAERSFKQLSRYPAVKWDLAIIVSETVGAGDIIKTIKDSNLSLVKSAEIFDVYRGKPISSGEKSVALSVTYHSEEKTLDDETVGKVHKKVIDLVLSKFDAKLREE